MDNKQISIKAVVFDIGGVIALDVWENMFIDPEKGLAKHFNLSTHEVHKFGIGLWEDFAYVSAFSKEETDKLESDYWGRFIERFDLNAPIDFFVSKTNEFVTPILGMTSIVSDLKQKNIELGICSNNSEFFHRQLVNQLDFYKYFDPRKEILSSKMGCPKSSPDFKMFKKLDSVLDSKREQVLFIDDRQINIEKAIEFGFNALLFPAQSANGANYLRRILNLAGIL
jgi:FMN phosphatase YigB (HAD superfamily)